MCTVCVWQTDNFVFFHRFNYRLTVADVRRKLWVWPHLMFQFSGLPGDVALDAIRLFEDTALLAETEGGSPLPPGMDVDTRTMKLNQLDVLLKKYYNTHKAEAELPDTRALFMCTITPEQLEIEHRLEELNWLINRIPNPEYEYQRYYFVAPWTRKDLERDGGVFCCSFWCRFHLFFFESIRFYYLAMVFTVQTT